MQPSGTRSVGPKKMWLWLAPLLIAAFVIFWSLLWNYGVR